MAEDAQLAAAAATIAELRRELAATELRLTRADAALGEVAAQCDQTKAALGDGQRALASEREQHQRDLTAAAAALAAANTATAAARAAYVAVSMKFDRMFGEPVEDGIAALRKYRTLDNVEHASLEAARLHMAAAALGLTDAAAKDLAARAAANPAAMAALVEIAP
ncbi:MAG TPA: hypothetical protein VMS01_04155 [Stellaceae bacterium]|nr:hypothetical protein [Stellaceae bacterium]